MNQKHCWSLWPLSSAPVWFNIGTEAYQGAMSECLLRFVQLLGYTLIIMFYIIIIIISRGVLRGPCAWPPLGWKFFALIFNVKNYANIWILNTFENVGLYLQCIPVDLPLFRFLNTPLIILLLRNSTVLSHAFFLWVLSCCYTASLLAFLSPPNIVHSRVLFAAQCQRSRNKIVQWFF